MHAVLLIGEDGAVNYASPSAARALGYSPDEFAGSTILELVHMEDRPELEELLAQILPAPDVVQAAPSA